MQKCPKLKVTFGIIFIKNLGDNTECARMHFWGAGQNIVILFHQNFLWSSVGVGGNHKTSCASFPAFQEWGFHFQGVLPADNSQIWNLSIESPWTEENCLARG